MSASRQEKAKYEHIYGKVPEGYHLHRIIPGYLGGKYTPDNLIALSVEEHALTHLMCYRFYNDPRDLTAYHVIKEQRGISKQERASLGGKISGQFQKSEFQREQGRKGGKVGIGDHIDRQAYSISRRHGGKASAEKHAKLGKGSFAKVECEYCGKIARLVDIARWHKKCKPGGNNEPT